MHAFRPAGISAKIDEQLKLSQAIDKAGAKVEELKGSVTSKVCHAPHAPRHALLESATAPPPLPPPFRLHAERAPLLAAQVDELKSKASD